MQSGAHTQQQTNINQALKNNKRQTLSFTLPLSVRGHTGGCVSSGKLKTAYSFFSRPAIRGNRKRCQI